MRPEAGAGDRLEAVVTLHPARGTDPLRAERLLRLLRGDVARVAGVEMRPAPPEPVPEGAKGGDGTSVMALLVAMSASGGVLTVLLRTLNTWIAQRPGRGITVTVTVGGDSLSIDGATHPQAQELLRAFAEARAAGPAAAGSASGSPAQVPGAGQDIGPGSGQSPSGRA